MHESGFSDAILAAALRRADGRRLRALTVRVGAAHQLAGDALEDAFAHAAEGTPAEGADITFVVVPVLLRCNDCGATTATEDAWATCGSCGSADVESSGGDELLLESIELAGADAGGT
ncbi:MAG TPA: hydrogenase maturation nickel metallochaperone HypA [Actinomycetota bacterium]|jgi:hydrogenase nickel incorporation protein HypA/HybF